MENCIFERVVLAFLQTYKKNEALLLTRREISSFVNLAVDKENVNFSEQNIIRLKREITDAIYIYYQCEY